jgi:hypothetical protein
MFHTYSSTNFHQNQWGKASDAEESDGLVLTNDGSGGMWRGGCYCPKDWREQERVSATWVGTPIHVRTGTWKWKLDAQLERFEETNTT